jgi:uncharacterized protein YxjI
LSIKDDILLVQQIIDFSEIVLPFETRNRYKISDTENNYRYFAYEIAGVRWWSWIYRMLLVGYRPFTIKVIHEDQSQLLEAIRPFRFYFHRMDVYDSGKWVGRIERRFSLLYKLYHLYDKDNNFLCELRGAIWKPWTFNVMQGDKTYGQIKKTWSGMAKEFFTDTDLFGVQFPDGAEEHEKKLLLASVFLIDFIYFEGNTGLGYMPDAGI